MLRRSALLLLVVACMSALVASGCGSSKSTSTPAAAQTATATTHLAKTKFVLHFGLAAGAFHRYIYKPFKAGAFSKPLSHKLALVKASAAALFTYHELKLAATDAKSSKVLRTLFSPITLLAAKFASLRTDFLHGKYDPAAINAAQASGGSIASSANAKGYPTSDLTPPRL